MIRILIADDHAVVRKGLKETFEEIADMKVEAQAATGAQALQKVQKQKFDVVIMDISMPGRSGLEVLQEIKKRRPDTRVLIYSMHDEGEFAVRALKSGAAGYLMKENPLEELIKAVKTVLAGRKYFSASVAQQLAWNAESEPGKSPHEKLSNREYRVLQFIASGKSLKQIAGELSVSAKTVTTYRIRILEKMKLKTNADLVQYVLTNRLSK